MKQVIIPIFKHWNTVLIITKPYIINHMKYLIPVLKYMLYMHLQSKIHNFTVLKIPFRNFTF